MEVPGLGRARAAAILFAISFVGVLNDPGLERVSPRELLEHVGRRLSRSMSEAELTALATRGDRLLHRLEPSERASLAKNGLRFQLASSTTVFVAALEGGAPFWLAERGFEPTELALDNPDGRLRVFRRRFVAGWVELGVNGLDRTPPGHYVVFVRAEAQDASGGIVLDPARSNGWRVARARVGASSASDQMLPFRSMPAELDGAILLQPAHANRHDALLASGRVWKTHVVAATSPDQITAAYGAAPDRELIWTWRTRPGSPMEYLRLARPSSGAVAPLRILRSTSELIECPSVLNDPLVTRHRVSVADLEPDTRYVYSIGDGSPQGWTPWRTMKTAPAAGGPTRFLYLGDAQTGLEGWGRLLKTAAGRHPDLDFLLIAGDLVDRGNERTNWDHFFLRAAGVFDRMPLMPCVGNHEYLDMGPRLYRAFFETPRNGPAGIDSDLVYKFECGDAFVAVLDSTLASTSPAKARLQAEWLDDALARTQARWKFVVFHHPLYPSHPWRDVPSLRSAWVPVIDKHHVDLVLQGHDHAYLRTHPMRAGRRASGAESGTYYVIAVSGDKFVADQPPRDYIEVGRPRVSTYQIIDINPGLDRLTYQAWTENGRLVDELVIDKGRGTLDSRSDLPRGEHPPAVVSGSF